MKAGSLSDVVPILEMGGSKVRRIRGSSIENSIALRHQSGAQSGAVATRSLQKTENKEKSDPFCVIDPTIAIGPRWQKWIMIL